MPLRQKDYFELKIFESQQMQEKAFSELPVSAYKQILHKEELNGCKSPPWEFHRPGRRDSYPRSDEKLASHPYKLCHLLKAQ